MSTTDRLSTDSPGSDLDPYAPIEVVPTSPIGGGAPTAYRVHVEDETADGGVRRVGTVPARQLIVSNRELRTMAREIAGQMSWACRGPDGAGCWTDTFFTAPTGRRGACSRRGRS